MSGLRRILIAAALIVSSVGAAIPASAAATPTSADSSNRAFRLVVGKSIDAGHASRKISLYAGCPGTQVDDTRGLFAPDPPGDVQAVADTGTAGSVTVSWTVPPSNGSAIRCYVVKWRGVEGAESGYKQGVPARGRQGDRMTLAVTGLAPGVDYLFQVAAVSQIAGTFQPSADPVAAAGAPLKLDDVAADLVVRDITLTWSAPQLTGGSGIRGYVIQRKIDREAWGAVSAAEVTTTALTWTDRSTVIGSAHSYRVATINRAGFQSDWSTATNTITPKAPTTPAKPTAEPGDRTVVATWKAADGQGTPVLGYEVRSRLVGGTWTASVALDAAARTYEIKNLDKGSTYEVQVRARNEVGWSAWSESSDPVTIVSLPTEPRSLAGTIDSKSIALTWVAPVRGGSSPTTGYMIEYSSNDGQRWTVATRNAQGTSYTLTGLTNGQAYLVRISAVTKDGEGDTAQTRTLTPIGLATAPRSLSPTTDDRSIQLTWLAPTDNGGADISSYEVQTSIDQGATWTKAASPSALTVTLKSLRNGTAYSVRVRALNAAGPGAWSTTVVATPRGLPDAPALTLKGGEQTFTATWTLGDDGGSAVDRVDVKWTLKGAFVGAKSRTAKDTSLVVQDLAAGTYEVSVSATTAQGTGAVTTKQVVVVGKPPVKPKAPVVSGTGGETVMNLSWVLGDDGGSPVTAITVTWSTGAGVIGTKSLAADRTSLELTGLAGGNYTVTVTATNAVGVSPAGTKTLVVTNPPPPAPPAEPEVTVSGGAGTLTVNWKILDNGGSPVTKVTVAYSRGTTLVGTRSSQVSNKTMIINGLDAGNYTVSVFVTSDIGDSPTVTLGAKVTAGVANTVPVQPTVTATGGAGEIVFNWAVSSNGGAPLTNIVADWTGAASGTLTTSAKTNPIRIANLAAGTYTLSVTAQNAVGNSTPRLVQVTVTAAGGATVPQGPTTTVSSPAPGQLKIDWTFGNSGGSPITQAQVVILLGTTTVSSNTYPNTRTSVTSTELAGGTYTVRVTAINAVGQSTATSKTQVVAEIDRTTAPDVPTNIVLTGAKGGFKATWAIASDGGRAITESRIRYRISTVADFGTPAVVYTTVRAFTATSLAKGTYSVQIAAVNTKGVSAWTASKTVTVT
jgi:hypothetical protein